MNQQDKKRFLNQLINGVKAEIIKKVPLMPDAWDGHELRTYTIDCFKCVDMRTLNGRRRREYINAVSTSNL